MNHLQLLLLKLIEECGEVATEVLIIKQQLMSISEGAVSCDYESLNTEMRDYCAVVYYLSQKYALGYLAHPVLLGHDVIRIEQPPITMSRPALADHVMTLTLRVQKIASKTMQFGMHEFNPQMSICNKQRLVDELIALSGALRQYIVQYNTGFEFTMNNANNKMLKLDKYAEYSRTLGCVSSAPVPECLYLPGEAG